MLSYFLKCRKNTGSKSPKVVNTKNGRIMLLSKRAVCGSKISWRIIQSSEKPKKFEKRKVYLSFIDKVWGTDLVVMQLINKFNHGFYFTICYWYFQ